MKKRIGVVPYEGPEKMHGHRRKEVLSQARFIMKFIKYLNLEGFRIYVVVRDDIDNQTDIIVRKKDSVW